MVARHSFRLYMEIRADLKDFVRALSEVLEEVDPYTRHHSVRVSEYAVRVARAMRLKEREVEEIEYAALVHDLGNKLGCGAHLATLRRAVSGKFDVAAAITLDAVMNLSTAELEKRVIPYLKLAAA
jgi:tRNA U55 pseudouridine synthase TruB